MILLGLKTSNARAPVPSGPTLEVLGCSGMSSMYLYEGPYSLYQMLFGVS